MGNAAQVLENRMGKFRGLGDIRIDTRISFRPDLP